MTVRIETSMPSGAEAERRRLRALLNQGAAAIAVLRGPDYIFELVNARYERLVGRAAADLIGKPLPEALPEIAGPELVNLLARVYRTGETVTGPERLVRLRSEQDGVTNSYFKFVFQRSQDPGGEADEIFVHALDVTEEVEARRRIEESEKRLAGIFNQASVGIAQADMEGRFMLANQCYCELVGRSLEELSRIRTIDVTHPDDRQRTQELYDRAMQFDQAFEIEKRYLRPNGESVWVHQALTAIRDEEGKPVYSLTVVNDITARKQAEEALLESEQQLRTLADSIPQLAWMAAPDGFVFWYNRRWYEYTGTSFEHMQGWRWQSVHDPEVLPRVLERWRESLREGIPFEMEYPLRRSDGAFRRFLTRVIPVHDSHGKVTGWFGTNTDIEDQKQAEEAIRQQQKLESTGVLAGGVAHDFNNLLTGVLGNASLMLETLPHSDPNAMYLREIIQAAERAAHLTRQMLAYAGKGSFVRERLDLSTHVREIGTLIHAAIPRQVAVEMALAPDLPAIEADPGQLQQIIMNLVINAAEAIGEDRNGRVQVATRCEDISPAIDIQFIPERPAPGVYVVLDVADNGIGMDEDVRAKIFDPFFSTKFAGRGLGLSAVLGIVRSGRGAVTVESTPGSGSRIRVYFPAVARAAPRAAPRAERSNEAGLTEPRGGVLVVDDEGLVREIAKSTLEHHGYSVLLANDGREAVEIFRKNARRINLVLLDLTMPLMGGEETLRALRRIQPGVSVILSSGYDEKDAMRKFNNSRLSGFLQKPYTAARLLSAVASAFRKSELPAA
jgi:PAS domain S-box-containing protein